MKFNSFILKVSTNWERDECNRTVFVLVHVITTDITIVDIAIKYDLW